MRSSISRRPAPALLSCGIFKLGGRFLDPRLWSAILIEIALVGSGVLPTSSCRGATLASFTNLADLPARIAVDTRRVVVKVHPLYRYAYQCITYRGSKLLLGQQF